MWSSSKKKFKGAVHSLLNMYLYDMCVCVCARVHACLFIYLYYFEREAAMPKNVGFKTEFGDQGKKNFNLDMCLILGSLVLRFVPFYGFEYIHFQL